MSRALPFPRSSSSANEGEQETSEVRDVDARLPGGEVTSASMNSPQALDHSG